MKINTMYNMNFKALLFFAVLLTFACIVNAQEVNQEKRSGILGHGYRGFVEIERLSDDGGLLLYDIQTTHGYQFNPHFYAGLGIGLCTTLVESASILLADFRYDILKGKHTPFVDLRFSGDHGLVIRPSVGYRYKHFNVSIGGWFRKYENSNYFALRLGFDFGGRKPNR